MKATLVVRAALLASLAASMLAACASGGGGGGSAANPPPMSPPASPPPANTSLAGPLLSEVFTNDSASGSATFSNNTGQATSATAALSTVTFEYQAASNTYKIANGSRSQTFGPSQLDASRSTAISTSYIRTSGSTTDSLVTTKPGDSGALTYRYVGGAVWQRTVSGSATTTGSLDAVAYGVETPDSALVRTGVSRFDVDLLGAGTDALGVVGVAGNGVLRVDFARGEIGGSGFIQYIDVQSGLSKNSDVWSLTAKLGSSNAFNGAFNTRSYSTSNQRLSGAVAGRFYGPSAEEIGGAFYVLGTDTFFNSPIALAGVLLGRRSEGGLPNLRLDELYFDETFAAFQPRGLRHEYRRPEQCSSCTDAHPYSITYVSSISSIAYDADDKSYSIAGPYATYTFGPADRVTAESSPRFTTYKIPIADGVERLVLYNPGPGNDELALLYASFGSYSRISTPAAPDLIKKQGEFHWFAYGIRSNDIPVSGHGIYNGIIYGSGASSHDLAATFDIRGDIKLDFDFTKGSFDPDSFTGSVRANGIAPDGRQFDIGTFNIESREFIRPGEFRANLTTATNNFGRLTGAFYGPNGEEVAGTMDMNLYFPPNPGDSSITSGNAVAAFAAKR